MGGGRNRGEGCGEPRRGILLFVGRQRCFGAVVEFLGIPDGRVLFEKIEELLEDCPGGWGRSWWMRFVAFADDFCGCALAIQVGPPGNPALGIAESQLTQIGTENITAYGSAGMHFLHTFDLPVKTAERAKVCLQAGYQDRLWGE